MARGTVEEKIVELHRHKRNLADSLLEGTEVAAHLSGDDLLRLSELVTDRLGPFLPTSEER